MRNKKNKGRSQQNRDQKSHTKNQWNKPFFGKKNDRKTLAKSD
jgi:hypothetical protein